MRPSEFRAPSGVRPSPSLPLSTMRQQTGSPTGFLALCGFALRAPPMPDQCLTVGGVLARPVLFRNSPFQFFDGTKSF